MTAKQHNIPFHLFMAILVAVALLQITMAYEHRPNHDGPPSDHHHHDGADNDSDADGERKIHWPSSATITIHRSAHEQPDAAQLNRPNNPHSAQENDTDGERKFHWPSSMSITIGRAAQLPESSKLNQLLLGLQLVSCNHTAQAGRSCADCSHTLLCFPNNVGIQRDCGSQYCDEGSCNPQPSAACNETSNA